MAQVLQVGTALREAQASLAGEEPARADPAAATAHGRRHGPRPRAGGRERPEGHLRGVRPGRGDADRRDGRRGLRGRGPQRAAGGAPREHRGRGGRARRRGGGPRGARLQCQPARGPAGPADGPAGAARRARPGRGPKAIAAARERLDETEQEVARATEALAPRPPTWPTSRPAACRSRARSTSSGAGSPSSRRASRRSTTSSPTPRRSAPRRRRRSPPRRRTATPRPRPCALELDPEA